jgi:hypothetical protein
MLVLIETPPLHDLTKRIVPRASSARVDVGGARACMLQWWCRGGSSLCFRGLSHGWPGRHISVIP